MPIGRPSIVTPNRAPSDGRSAAADAAALRPWQQAIDNIRERFRAAELAVAALRDVDTAAALSSSRASASILSRLDAIERLLIGVNFEALLLISLNPAADGDVLTWDVDAGQYVPEAPDTPEGGIYMPVVLGDIPPTLVYLPDGNLVYTRVE
jgi:hypothetical protein